MRELCKPVAGRARTERQTSRPHSVDEYSVRELTPSLQEQQAIGNRQSTAPMSVDTSAPNPPLTETPNSVSASTPLEPGTPVAPKRRLRWRPLALASAFALGVIIAAGALVVVALTRAAPSWWQPVDSANPAMLLRAEGLEAGLSQALTQPRDSSMIWTARLSEVNANIWLNTRLRRWLESQPELGIKWPEQLSELRVSFQGDTLRVGAMVEQNGATQVFTATLAPRFEKDGSLWMPAESIALGRLSIPAGWVLGDGSSKSRASEQTSKVSQDIAKLPETQRVLSAFAGKNAVRQDPTVRLPDGRRVRILGLSAKDGHLLITCQTMQRGENAPRPSVVGQTPTSTPPPRPGTSLPPREATHPPAVERES